MTVPTDPTDELVSGTENYLAALDQAEFDDLVGRVRPPAATTPATRPAVSARAAGAAEADRRFGPRK